MVTVTGDVDSIFEKPGSEVSLKPGSEVSLKRKAEGEGQRENLRVYETMPSQLLNAYGMAGFAKMDKEKVWEELNKPLKTGAKYMTELCSAEEERRGVGINRFLQVLVEYLKYQKTDQMRKQNEFNFEGSSGMDTATVLSYDFSDEVLSALDSIAHSAT